MKQEIDNNAMWAAFRQELALHEEFQVVVAAIDNALNNLGFTIEETSTIIPIPLKQGEQKPTDKVKPKFKVGDWVIDKQGIVHQIANVIENVTCHTYGYDIVGGGYFNDNTEGVRLWTIQDAKDGDVLYTSSTASNEVFIFKGLTIEGYIECYCSYDSEDKYREGKYHFIGKPTFMTHPATKEQRDTLFVKMKEAGYVWDAEKKELKKIEQKPQGKSALEAAQEEKVDNQNCVKPNKVEPKFKIGDIIRLKDGDGLEWTVEGVLNNGYYTIVCADRDDFIQLDDKWELVEQKPAFEMKTPEESLGIDSDTYNKIVDECVYELEEQKPAWSEEDKDFMYDTLSNLTELKDRYGEGYGNVGNCINWLKSIRPQQWKPSDEQMEALDDVISSRDIKYDVLSELWKDLKKLK